MNARVKVRPSEVAKRRSRRVSQVRPGERRAERPRVAPPATQRGSQRRPGGVRAPRVDNPVRMNRHRQPSAVPPVMVSTGLRLTDRGLALAMLVTIALVFAAVLCIATTAVRVTAEPVGGNVAAASAAR